jgi:hypothetical protein
LFVHAEPSRFSCSSGRSAFELGGGEGGVRSANTRLIQAGAESLGESADEAYAAIRASTSDIAEIAQATGFKPRNLQTIKDHLFYREHLLDRYVDYGIPAEMARFDSDAAIAAAW